MKKDINEAVKDATEVMEDAAEEVADKVAELPKKKKGVVGFVKENWKTALGYTLSFGLGVAAKVGFDMLFGGSGAPTVGGDSISTTTVDGVDVTNF